MRKIFYVVFFVLFIGGTIYKARSIVARSKLPIVSIKTEWEKKGKPVSALKVKEERLWNLQKVAAQYSGAGIFRASVSRDIQELLKAGQSFEARKNDLNIQGQIQYVSAYADPVTGLFGVTLKVSKAPDLLQGDIITAHVKTDSNILIKIPHDAVQTDEKGEYCWVIKEKHAVKIRIPGVIDYNGMYFGLRRGLKTGALVCFEGTDQLNDKDKVNVIEGSQDDR